MDILIVCLIFLNSVLLSYYSTLYWIIETENINKNNWFYTWLIYNFTFIGVFIISYLILWYVSVYHWKQTTMWVINKLLPSYKTGLFIYLILLVLGLLTILVKMPPKLTKKYLLEDENSSINKYNIILFFRIVSFMLVIIFMFLLYTFRTQTEM
jgi:hypothetical protein